ncbi:DUF551 domain-containing protein [Cronobacter sakazakii]
MSELNELIASEIADFFAGFGGPGEPDIQNGEAQRLLTGRVLSVLALRERAEPVAWRWRWSDDAEGDWRYTEERRETRGSVTAVPLYTAPPAQPVAVPVVPDGLRIALSNAGIAAPESDEMLWASQQDYIQMLVTWVKDRKPFKPVAVSDETFDEWSRRCEIQLTLCRPEFREVAEISWNACRAAMLAAPPAPVTAGWIACSERMPEVGDIVLTADNGGVNVGEMEHSGASYRYFTSVVSGRELPATHWMPLPEAPTKN